MTLQIILPAIGGLSLRFAVLRGELGIFNIAFWASLVATVNAFIYYSFQYWDNPTPPFFHVTYQFGLLDIAAIWVIRIIVDTFNVCNFIYLASQRKIVKAAAFVTLNTIFVVIFHILMGSYPPWIFPYLFLIYSGYSLIAYDRKKVFEQRMKALVKVKFITKIDGDTKARKYSELTFGPEITNEELMATISK